MDDAFLVRDLPMSVDSMTPVVTMDGNTFDQLPIPNAVVQEKTMNGLRQTKGQTMRQTNRQTGRQTDIFYKIKKID